jgi:BTB/POZ domain-containing protein 1/2
MTMFYGTGCQLVSEVSKTNTECNSKTVIELPDVEPESFKIMLRYLYTDWLEIGPDNVMSTLYLAKKYAIQNLEKECVNFLKLNLRSDNAFMLLEQALLFDEVQLAELCLNIIDKNACDTFSSDYFLDIDLKTLNLVIKRDTLGIREVKLYEYLIKWAQNKCKKSNLDPSNCENMKSVLSDSIKHIRFPLMTQKEFALLINDSKNRILDDELIIDLFINLTLTHSPSSPTPFTPSETPNNYILPKKLGFSHKARCCLGGKEQVINRFCQIESRWGYSGTSDRVKFSVNRKIYVVGFGLFGAINGQCEYSAHIQLIHFESSNVCAENPTNFNCDGTNSTFKVMFKEPVEIQPDTYYVAAATIKVN